MSGLKSWGCSFICGRHRGDCFVFISCFCYGVSAGADRGYVAQENSVLMVFLGSCTEGYKLRSAVANQ